MHINASLKKEGLKEISETVRIKLLSFQNNLTSSKNVESVEDEKEKILIDIHNVNGNKLYFCKSETWSNCVDKNMCVSINGTFKFNDYFKKLREQKFDIIKKNMLKEVSELSYQTFLMLQDPTNMISENMAKNYTNFRYDEITNCPLPELSEVEMMEHLLIFINKNYDIIDIETKCADEDQNYKLGTTKFIINVKSGKKVKDYVIKIMNNDD